MPPSNPLACTSSFCVSAMNEGENGLSSTRKLPAVGLTVFQQHVNRLGSAVLLTGADQQEICLVT
jgi:hypothetical protein